MNKAPSQWNSVSEGTTYIPKGQCCMPERKFALYAATDKQVEYQIYNTDYSMARVIKTPIETPASLKVVIA